MWRGPLLEFETGEKRASQHTHPGLGALCVKVEYLQGAPPLVEPLTHTQTSYAGTRELIRRWATVVRYNRLFAWSMGSCPRGEGIVSADTLYNNLHLLIQEHSVLGTSGTVYQR